MQCFCMQRRKIKFGHGKFGREKINTTCNDSACKEKKMNLAFEKLEGLEINVAFEN